MFFVLTFLGLFWSVIIRAAVKLIARVRPDVPLGRGD